MFDYDYVISKLHARHSKSPMISRRKELDESQSIERLYQVLFPEQPSLFSASRLYSQIENDYKKIIYDEINRISGYFHFNNPIVNSYILKYEIDNIKLLVKYHLNGKSTVKKLFEIQLKNTLDYDTVYQENIADYQSMVKILKNTQFNFILPFIEKKEELYLIENRLDRFYYSNLMDCLREYSREEHQKLISVLRMEMNFQNITWALRLKYYYRKKYSDVSGTFLREQGLIPARQIEELMDMQFVPGEAEKMTGLFPSFYQEMILRHITPDGDPIIHELETDLYNQIFSRYLKNFYLGFEIVGIISYINLKISEYYQLVRMVETLRYKRD